MQIYFGTRALFYPDHLDGVRKGRMVRDRTKGIDQSHLLDCAPRHVEEARAGENNA
jgi:hypothetical protein